MTVTRQFTKEEAAEAAQKIGLDFNQLPFDLNQFWRGMNVELEHGKHDPQTNVTNDNPLITGKIALAHLKEIPDYYDRLEKMEADAEGK